MRQHNGDDFMLAFFAPEALAGDVRIHYEMLLIALPPCGFLAALTLTYNGTTWPSK